MRGDVEIQLMYDGAKIKLVRSLEWNVWPQVGVTIEVDIRGGR